MSTETLIKIAIILLGACWCASSIMAAFSLPKGEKRKEALEDIGRDFFWVAVFAYLFFA